MTVSEVRHGDLSWILEWGRSFLDRIEPKPDPAWSPSARFWANPAWSLFCCAFLVTALFHPPNGLPFRFCLFHALFGLDCPGCGLTRGLSNVWRGRIVSAVDYHLFAPVVFAYLALQSVFLGAPVRLRLRVVSFLNGNDFWIRKTSFLGVVLFFVYGVWRMLAELVGGFSGVSP